MKILFLSNVYPPPAFGGYEMRCKEQVDELKKRGHETFVLTSRLGLAKSNDECDVYRLLHFHKMGFGSVHTKKTSHPMDPFKRYNQLKLAFVSRRNYFISKRIIAILNPDIVYAWHMESITISPVLAAQDEGIPTVFNIGDYWLSRLKAELCLEPNPIKKKYRALILGLDSFKRLNLNHIIVISRSLMQSHIQLGFPENNITVIPRGIPVNLIQDASHILNSTKFNKEIIKLLFVGRIVPEKGPDIAIKAVAHLVYEMNYRKIQLDIIGTGPDKYLRELRDMVFSKGLKENIRFLGKLPHDQLLKCYETYDAFLFTSRWAEPLGITILEAMARGLLVVATNVGAASEIISDGINGLIVPKEEPIMIALAIKKISHDRGLAQKLRYAALNTVREDYGFERIVDESEKYLQKVIQEARSASKDKFAGRIL